MNEAMLGRVLMALNENIRAANLGTYAALRRYDTGSRAADVEVQALLRHVGVVPQSADEQQRWTLLLHCLTIAKCAHSSDAGAEVGAVLARLQVSEARIKQLVEAQSTDLHQVMPAIARRLAAGGWAVDWLPLAQLVLHTNTDQEALAQAARKTVVSHFLHQRRRRASSIGAALHAEAISSHGELHA